MSKLETITIDTPSGSSALQIGDGNTATIGLGKSGDTINIPAGATIANAGTATGFGVAGSIYFLARRGNTGQSVSNDTFTTIQFDTEMEDSGSVFNPSTYKFTPAVAGKYLVFTNLCFSVTDGDDWLSFTVLLDKNDAGYTDTNFKGNFSYINSRSSGDRVDNIFVQQIMDLDADDTVRVQCQGVWPSSSQAQTVGYGKSYFGGFRIA